MVSKAYNSVVFNGKEYKQAVVEYDHDGNVLRVYEFREELPFTEWIGGELNLDSSRR